jgi:hypothetical protein
MSVETIGNDVGHIPIENDTVESYQLTIIRILCEMLETFKSIDSHIDSIDGNIKDIEYEYWHRYHER